MNMRLVRSFAPIIIIAVAFLVAFILVISRKPPVQKPKEEKSFLVHTIKVDTQNVEFKVHSQGTVMPKVKTSLIAQVSGKVMKVSDAFVDGGMFHKGDVLVQLEKADYITAVKSAEADLARAQAALKEEIAKGKVAQDDWRNVHDTKPTPLGLRKPQLEQEQANVKAAEANLEKARRNLKRTEIIAPYDGLVKSKKVDIGQYVGLGSQLAEIYDTGIAEVRLPLSDNDMAYLNIPEEGQPGPRPQVKLTARVAGKVSHWQGTLVRTEGVVDQSSRVIHAVVQVRDPYAREPQHKNSTPLKYGRFVNATINGIIAKNIVKLPRHVIRIDGSVLLANDQHKLHIQPVNVIKTDDNYAFINEGLKDGELVIDSAVPHPINGMKIRLPGEKPSSAEGKGTSQTKNAVKGVAK